ncbi:MAG: YdcF family protein [Balneolales bacterium]|nr:YdcF family protein [Balneolales bacterium]
MLEGFLRFIYDLILPSSQLQWLAIIGLVLLFWGKIDWAKKVFILLLVLFFVYGTPWLSNSLIDRLENYHPPLTGELLEELQLNNVHRLTIESKTDLSSRSELELESESELQQIQSAQAFSLAVEDNGVYQNQDKALHANPIRIVVLGAGHSPDPRLAYTQMLGESVSMRLIEGIRLYHALPGSKLVTSASAVYGELSQAEALRRAAISLGVDEGDISTQDTPRNTCEESRAFAQVHPEGTFVLVSTSALHSRRAVMLFQKQGMDAVAAPAMYVRKINPDRPPRSFHRQLIPRLERVDRLESAIKEIVGYRWDKRTC